jgi:hypothetical protein
MGILHTFLMNGDILYDTVGARFSATLIWYWFFLNNLEIPAS